MEVVSKGVRHWCRLKECWSEVMSTVDSGVDIASDDEVEDSKRTRVSCLEFDVVPTGGVEQLSTHLLKQRSRCSLR